MTDLTPIREAWEDAGPVPAYHYKIKAQLLMQWPTLYLAIEKVLRDNV